MQGRLITNLWRLFTVLAAASAVACSGANPAAPTPPPSQTPVAPAAVVAPTITTQPAAQSINENATATLTVAADGTAPMTFQWYSGESGATASPVSGATSATLTTPPMTATSSFWVRVANTAGAANSAAATVTVVPAPPPPPPPPPPPVDAATTFENQVVALVNLRRAAGAVCGGTPYGTATALAHNAQLRTAARLHSTDMATVGYFSHVSLDGRTFSQRISGSGYSGPSPWGENIGAGYSTPESVVDGWMASPGHCANIMNPAFRGIGAGYAFNPSSPFGRYWTLDFGGGP